MKYIRTKDGIKAYNESCDLSYVYQSIGGIEIANTIEELCDEFVYVRPNGYKEQFRSLVDVNYDSDLIKNGYQIYGAIWTDKGLIYVAKMNEEGELELL